MRVIALVVLALIAIQSVGLAQDTTSTTAIEDPPTRLDGSISISGNKYSVSGALARRPATGWSIIGTPTLTIHGFTLPFTFIFSDQESDVRQPFDQIGVSPQYKWITLHLGYRSLTYSKYTLAGITFLGAGIDLTPSPLRFSAMYGRFQRAVEEDTTNYSIQPAYERMGYAVKLGVGSEQTFVDLIYLHAKDDSLSLKYPPAKVILFPQENTILALNTKVQIIKELSIDAEVASSILTRDIRSPLLDSTQVPSFFSSLIDLRTSTSLLLASTAGLTLKVPHFRIRLGYERVEPDYASLGAYYYTTDIENYTIAPGFDLFNNKLRISGSIGIQNDNVLDTKLATTNRFIGAGTISVNPSQSFGVDLNYANYSTQQGTSSPASTLINDSTRVSSIAQSASITPRFLFISPATTQSIVVSGSYQDYTDQNIFTQKYSNSKTMSGTANYTISFNQTGLSLGGSLLLANTEQTTSSTMLEGITVNASKTLAENRLSIGGSLGYTKSLITPADSLAILIPTTTTNTYTQSINLSYKLNQQGSILFTLYATESISSAALVPKFIEILATVTYTHNFSF